MRYRDSRKVIIKKNTFDRHTRDVVARNLISHQRPPLDRVDVIITLL